MGYAVYHVTEDGVEAVSRSFARRAAAESRKHVVARQHPEWAEQLVVRDERTVERERPRHIQEVAR